MWKNKVIWCEGTFLQTQHFQQQERYLENLLDQTSRFLHAYNWGVTSLQLDRGALAHGQFRIDAAAGILPDGTVFDVPEQDAPPRSIDIDIDKKNSVVYLAIPRESDGEASVCIDAPALVTMHRFTAQVVELRDSIEGFHERHPVQLGKLNLRLLHGTNHSEGYSRIGIARIVECKADGQVVLDPNYIPPVLSVDASPVLRAWLNELRGLVIQRSDVLAQRMSQPGRGGMGEIADFLLLMAVNRYSGILNHLATISGLHPERFYRVCLEMAHELASFGNERRVTRELPAYNHDDLQACFVPVMTRLRLALSMVLEQTALQIELHDRKYGVRVAVINDKQLLNSANFVLAVNAQLPGEAVRSRFPTQTKIGSIEKIRDLVNLQLQGIPLRPMNVAPRQIPYHSGFNYFELDTGHELWRQLGTSGGMAMHIAGEFPGLELELWAIRRAA